MAAPQTLLFEPGPPGGAPRVVVECMNAAPEGPPLRAGAARVLLAPAGDNAAAAALAALLCDAPLAAVLHAPQQRSLATAAAVAGACGGVTQARRCACASHPACRFALAATLTHAHAQALPALGGADGAWDAASGERLRSVWARADSAWAEASATAAAQPAGDAPGGVLLIADALTLAAVLCHALVRHFAASRLHRCISH